MGADSALTFDHSGDDELSLLGFPKIIKAPKFSLGISVAGSAKVTEGDKTQWISKWLQTFVDDTKVTDVDTFDGFCDRLVDALEALHGSRGINILQCATWVITQDTDGAPRAVPHLVEVSNESGEFLWRSVLDAEVVQDMVSWREGDRKKGYPISFRSTGIPEGFHQWIAEFGGPAFTELVGKNVPDPQISAVAEYVRFLIRTVAELHRVARMTAYVGEPVETLLLFPEGMNMFSTRY